MTQPEGTDTTGTKTFTQAEVDQVAAAARKRERDAIAAKYADYDDLKVKATQADADKGKLDQVLAKLTDAESRASKAEAAQTRGNVAAAKKLPAWMAKKLTGSTQEELEADADEMLAEFKKHGGKIDGETTTGTETTTTDDRTPAQQPAPRRGRPQETLQSGAPVTRSEPEETDPIKLAALIPRR